MPNYYLPRKRSQNHQIYMPSFKRHSDGLYLHEVGRITAQQRIPTDIQLPDSYMLFIITGGSNLFQYQGESYRLTQGDCFFASCDSPIHLEGDTKPWSISWLHIKGSIVATLYVSYLEASGTPVFHPKNTEKFQALIHDIFTYSDETDQFQEILILKALSSLLALFIEENKKTLQPARSPDSDAQLLDIKQYIDHHFREILTLDDLANQFFINKYTLCRTFRKRYGQTPMAYVISTRINQAKHLLSFSELSIEEIAWASGFSDPNYFSRAFRKQEECTPGEFRKKWAISFREDPPPDAVPSSTAP